MKILLAATAAMGLALSATPSLAQTNTGSMQKRTTAQPRTGAMKNGAMQMTAEQKADYQSWTQDQQTTYDAWPQPAKDYYWTLSDQQKDVWWNLLTDQQRVRIVQMNPQQQQAAWTSINAQVSGQTNSNMNADSSMNNGSMNSGSMSDGSMNDGAMNSNMPANNGGNIRYVNQGMVQNVPTDQAATSPDGQVPVCKKGETDNCMNPYEAGKRGAGVSKPLGYYPDKAVPKN